MKPRVEQYGCIEIGTGTIKVAIGSVREDDTLEIQALATRPSLKMLRGEPTNPAIVSEQLVQAMEEARAMAGLKEFPRQTALLLSGGFIRPQILRRQVEVPCNEPISSELQEKLFLENCNEAMARDTESEHVLNTIVERLIRLDNDRIVFSATGLYAVQAELESYYFSYNDSNFQSFASVITQTGYPWQQVRSVLYAPLAIASAIFPPSHSDECLGLVIDIGGGVTSIVMPAGPGYVVCEQLLVGCDNIANDISIVMDVDIGTARRILNEMNALKLTAVPNGDGDSRKIDLVSHGPEGMPAHRFANADMLEQIIHARLQEIFELVKERLEELDAFDFIGNEVLLSGGGALIPRVTELASQVFCRKAKVAQAYRVSWPEGVAESPRNIAVAGLMRAFHKLMALREAQGGGAGWGIFDKIKDMIRVLKW